MVDAIGLALTHSAAASGGLARHPITGAAFGDATAGEEGWTATSAAWAALPETSAPPAAIAAREASLGVGSAAPVTNAPQDRISVAFLLARPRPVAARPAALA